MRSFWSDPYLWIHLAGLAVLPLWLELCFLGLAVGDPIFPIWLELAFVAIAGIVPILWMQWQRPFYIFSLLAIALKPEKLTLPQRQLLTRFKTTQNRLLAVAVAILLAIVLHQLYIFAPIGAAAVPFSIESRGLGLLVAAIAFLGSNLFLQVPVSVASVMLTSDAAFDSTEPYPLEQIAQDFTSLGLPVSQLLPEFLEDLAIVSPAIPTPVSQPEATQTKETQTEEAGFETDVAIAVPSVAESLPTAADTPKPFLLEPVAENWVESPVETLEATNIIEANDTALEELIVEIEEIAEVAAIAHPNEETANSPEVNIATESDREVEHDSAEDLDAIARIDEQSAAEVSSAETSSTEESETTSDSLE